MNKKKCYYSARQAVSHSLKEAIEDCGSKDNIESFSINLNQGRLKHYYMCEISFTENVQFEKFSLKFNADSRDLDKIERNQLILRLFDKKQFALSTNSLLSLMNAHYNLVDIHKEEFDVLLSLTDERRDEMYEVCRPSKIKTAELH